MEAASSGNDVPHAISVSDENYQARYPRYHLQRKQKSFEGRVEYPPIEKMYLAGGIKNIQKRREYHEYQQRLHTFEI